VTQAFYIAPFSAETAGNEDPEVFEAVAVAIRNAAEAVGINVQRADDIFAGGVIVEQIRGAIEQADLIVAMCTGRNPNVFYELGLAEAAGHKPILVARSVAELPFDVHHWRVQTYGETDGLADLEFRIKSAMTETLAERSRETPEFVLPTDPDPEAAQGGRPTPSVAPALSAVSDGNLVAFMEGLKPLIASGVTRFTDAANANWNAAPSPEVLEALAAIRYSSAESVLAWLAPATEYRPEWLERPLRMLGQIFLSQIRPHEGGTQFWQSANRTWVGLVLKSLVGLALSVPSPQSVARALSIPGPRDRDPSPLLIHPEFTWNAGYLGDSQKTFDDFRGFAAQSGTLRDYGFDSVSLACGTDLALGISRCVWDAGHSNAAHPQPHTYAGFAHYYCDRIQWIAREIDSSPEVAQALGAADIESMRTIAREWYPRLREQTLWGPRYPATCDTWDEAIQ
jgi:hypothetical protein